VRTILEFPQAIPTAYSPVKASKRKQSFRLLSPLSSCRVCEISIRSAASMRLGIQYERIVSPAKNGSSWYCLSFRTKRVLACPHSRNRELHAVPTIRMTSVCSMLHTHVPGDDASEEVGSERGSGGTQGIATYAMFPNIEEM